MMATAVVLLVLFVVSERHSQHPVITPSLFRKRSFVVGLMIVAGFYAPLSAFVLVINLLLQLGMGWTPLHTGVTLIPWALGTAVAVLLASAVLAEKLGRASLHLGLSIAVIGLLALGWSVARWGAGITVWKLTPALLLTGFGAGLVFVPLVDFILGDATTEEVGTGAGTLNAVQQFAGAIGVAALGTVFFARAGHPSVHSYFAAAELVFAITAGLYFLTLLLVCLLPRHAQQAHLPDAACGRLALAGLRSRAQATGRRWSAQDQEVKPVGPGFRAACLLSVPHGAAEPFLAAQELLVGEVAHDGVGAAERVCLGEEPGQADQRLGHRLKRVAAESRGSEGLVHPLEGGKGTGRPYGLGEELPGKGARRPGPARESLADQHRGAWAQHAADLSRSGFQVGDVVDHEGQPGAVRRAVRQRESAGVAR
jgi:MFS family permease